MALTPEQKQEKINRAISLGYIIKTIQHDGIAHYLLTPLGQAQWELERRMEARGW